MPPEELLPTAPPDGGDWAALDPSLWRRLLPHVRRALEDAAEHEPDPRLRQLAALPAARLQGGRARRDLQDRLGAGGVLWLSFRRRVLDVPGLASELGAALVGSPPEQVGAPPGPPVASVAPGDHDQRLRDRIRDARTERDEARRRADGEAARADREAAARRDIEATVADLRDRVTELEVALARAADDRTAAVDRERRRSETAVRELRDELRALRRQQEERARREAAEARATAEARAARQAAKRATPPEPSPPPGLVPGRPSRLPAGVAPDTTEAVDLLLHAGRRVLVDAYNVTRTHQAGQDLEGQRRWLVNLVAGAAAARRIEPILVFDGHDTPGPGSSRTDRGVGIVFTDEGITADDELEFRVAALPLDVPVVVVTDDRELRDRLRPHGVDLVHTIGFLGAVR